MTANELKISQLSNTNPEVAEEYSIPLDISDIINICREYHKLGWYMQSQVEIILEIGVGEAVKNGNVKQQSLPHIKSFLLSIYNNSYFGDASNQAYDCIQLIKEYEEKNKFVSTFN